MLWVWSLNNRFRRHSQLGSLSITDGIVWALLESWEMFAVMEMMSKWWEKRQSSPLSNSFFRGSWNTISWATITELLDPFSTRCTPPGQKEIPPHLEHKSELGTKKSRLRMDGGGGIKESGRERKEAFYTMGFGPCNLSLTLSTFLWHPSPCQRRDSWEGATQIRTVQRWTQVLSCWWEWVGPWLTRTYCSSA